MKKIQLLHQALQDTTVKEETAQRYLASIIKVAEKVTQERDSFVEAVSATNHFTHDLEMIVSY